MDIPKGTVTPRPVGLVKGMIRPSNGGGMSGNDNVDKLFDTEDAHFEIYDGEKWVKL